MPKGAEDEARKFYTGILGLSEIEKPDSLKLNGGLWYQLADIQLHIGTEEHIGKTKRHPAFEIKNSDEVKEYLTSKGVRVKEETPVPNQKRFSFLDPLDNRIEFLEII